MRTAEAGTVVARHDRPPASADDALVVVRDLVKVYGSARSRVLAIDRLGLTVGRGEFVALVGASGCGKSSLLHVLAGVEAPTGGSVEVRGRVAMMFQEAALFPWLTIRENVALPLRLAGVRRAARRRRTEELLGLVRLDGVGDRRPHELSGGMRQRAALARCLAQEAEVVLMDEPFAAVDAMTRDLLHDEVERLAARVGLTVLLVTHSVHEAVRLADRVVLLSSRPGRVAAEFRVDLPRPRRLDGPLEAGVAAAITDRLRAEVARHGRRPH